MKKLLRGRPDSQQTNVILQIEVGSEQTTTMLHRCIYMYLYLITICTCSIFILHNNSRFWNFSQLYVCTYTLI